MLDLNALISDFLPMLRRLIPESIEIRLSLFPELARIRADPTQLRLSLTRVLPCSLATVTTLTTTMPIAVRAAKRS